ncbi:asparagine-tRNA ligase [Kwoniella heveanensis CBS 569]|nr:asparagine-tRNA ligase [Kwoniella heveanensis CBS 569]
MRRSIVRLSTLPPNIRTILASRSVPSSSTSSSASSGTTNTSTAPKKGTEEQIANNGDNDAIVTVNGWIRSIRSHKSVAFAEVHDGSSSKGVQAVLKGKGKADGITNGTSVQLRGRLTKSRGQGQDVELLVEDVRMLGECDPEAYPIQKKSLPASVLRDNAHLRFRTSQTAATMRVRDALMRDWHDWFEENGFTHIHTPVLTGSDCEGAGEVFTIHDPSSSSASAASSSSSSSCLPVSTKTPPFFPHPVHLTVSGQLHLEAPTHALTRVYTLSPAFRAEPSLTSRHLSEFYMLEGEAAFVETLDQLLDLVEDGVRKTVTGILAVAAEEGTGGSKRGERIRQDLVVIARSLAESESSGTGATEVHDQSTLSRSDPLSHLRQVILKPFTRITYTAALDLLAEVYEREKPFEQDPPKWGEGIATEHEKCKAIENAGMNKEDYEWYLDLRRYGSVPHGGWGMGWERWVCWVTGVGNVRDVVGFARWKGHCKY